MHNLGVSPLFYGGKVSYERISLFLICACSALLGAAIGAWAVAWTEKRRYEQIYRAKRLFLLEKRLENLARVCKYVFATEEKIEERQLEEYREEIRNLGKKHPLLLFQIKIMDRKLYKYFLELASFLIEPLPLPDDKVKFIRGAQETAKRLEECLTKYALNNGNQKSRTILHQSSNYTFDYCDNRGHHILDFPVLENS